MIMEFEGDLWEQFEEGLAVEELRIDMALGMQSEDFSGDHCAVV